IWNDINQAGFLSLPDGSAFIGTSRGLAYYRPLENAVRPEPPDVVITSAKLGGIEMLDRKLPLVASKDSSFEVRYSGLTFKDPAKVRFRYRLAGLEEEYVETGLRQLRYPMLPAGTYTFEVHCLAADGLRSRVGASYTFTVETPWWLRWWSQLGLALAVIAVLLSILKARTYKLAADRRRLEIAVQERSAQLADANERLAKANNELRELSFTDALTGAKNRLFFSTVVESDVSAALRRHDPRSHPLERNSDLVFYLVDLDHFKTVNDSWGHASGDRVLQEAVRRLERSIRQSDLLVRWGGEEFLIMCRDTEQSEASVVARRILELIGGAPFVLDGVSLSRTCSVGWAVLPTPTAPTPRPISHHLAIVLADRALYLAKSSGRNQAVGVELREDILGRVKEDELLERPLQELDGVLFRLVRVPGPSGPPSPEPTQAAAP
ncbi:MAG: GGDEF domain-containing protein, partial [Deltaproteobacteria bacterium]|nr:GGDEF domain-containing protein [Deltaproteobacteria bacterium]